MSDDKSNPTEIRREMQAIRAQLDGELNGVVTNARQLFDWRYYYEKSPWIGMGLACALGYFVVPRKSRMSPSEETRKAVSESRRLVAQPDQGGWMSAAGRLLLPILVRIGVSHVAARMADATARQATHHDEAIVEDVT